MFEVQSDQCKFCYKCYEIFFQGIALEGKIYSIHNMSRIFLKIELNTIP